jgi:hypothetical protein
VEEAIESQRRPCRLGVVIPSSNRWFAGHGTFGVRLGRLAVEGIAYLCSEKPSRRVGLYERTGAIQPGSDADLVVVDPEKRGAQLLGLRAPAPEPGELIFAGAATSACVDLAAREAADRRFECVIVESATAELDEVSYGATLRQFPVRWGRVWATGEAPKNLADPRGGVTGLTAFRNARVEWPKENQDHDRNG